MFAATLRFIVANWGESPTEILWWTTKIIYLCNFLLWVAVDKLQWMVRIGKFCRENMTPQTLFVKRFEMVLTFSTDESFWNSTSMGVQALG